MINSYFFNALPNADGSWDREYNAENFSDYLNLIVGSGVFPNPSTNLQVMASSGFNLVVKAGSAWINGKKMENTTDYSITLDGSDVLLNRIDRVIFYLDMQAREMGIDILKGTPATNPVAPDLTRTATRQEYCLGTVAVNRQVSAISQADITDTRADSDVCGWVAGLIQQVDTSTLFNQWQAAYSAYYADVQQQLNDFVSTLTDTLRVNTYLTSFRKDTVLNEDSSYTVASGKYLYNVLCDMQYYTYELTDVINVYINGLLAIKDTDYTLNMAATGSSIDIIFSQQLTADNDVTIEILKTRIGIGALLDSNGNTIVTNNDDDIIIGG